MCSWNAWLKLEITIIYIQEYQILLPQPLIIFFICRLAQLSKATCWKWQHSDSKAMVTCARQDNPPYIHTCSFQDKISYLRFECSQELCSKAWANKWIRNAPLWSLLDLHGGLDNHAKFHYISWVFIIIIILSWASLPKVITSNKVGYHWIGVR